jgi:hypothetical protein
MEAERRVNARSLECLFYELNIHLIVNNMSSLEVP